MKKRIAAALAAAMLSVGVAHSADLVEPQPAPLQDAPEITVQQSSGWYLRGDTGYSFNRIRGAEYFQGSNSNLVDFSHTDLKDSFILGGGVGYQINNYLRTDLTFDYLGKSDFKGGTSGYCGTVACTSDDRANMKAYTLMANAYVDLGTYGYFTPYVGAGIGGSYVKWSKLHNTICDDPSVPGCYTTDHDGKSKWRLSYAFMAGTSIDITCNLKADIGYRYRRILGGDMFGYEENGGPGRDKGFASHEARIGARYTFGGCQTPVAYEPPPALPVYK
ncbi:outer membrane protein [Neorhizobium sp. NCHU2750]|uniref:outer membrane protein n=1 Tax=Neorhizobium sp. NCHU2750 TaxID=1825976 RepID=UPI000E764EF7|nr:HEAT resistant agglutinin 1 protein [Neorhizobium sp. NCHU2750]